MSMDMGTLAIDLAASADQATTDAGRANVKRATHGLAAVNGWVNATPYPQNRYDRYEPMGATLADVLTDLMHLARAADLDFDEILISAGNRHLEECEDELIAV